MTRIVSEYGLSCLKQWEGLRLKAYRDEAGVLTIGYGLTSASGIVNVRPEMTITKERAEEMLLLALVKYEQAVESAVRVPLNDNQYAALVSFCYNVGAPNFLGSTLLKMLNKGDYAAVPGQLMRWTKTTVRGKKVTSQGLVNRRAAEAGLWAKGEFVSSGYTEARAGSGRRILSPETVGPVVGAVSGLGGVAYGSGPFQYALAAIMVIACLVGAWWFIRHIRKEMT